jgi:hypothetical protein
MSTYRICSLGDGIGFKVQVTDASNSLRVVGIFADEAVARAWIMADRRAARQILEERRRQHRRELAATVTIPSYRA